MEQSKQASHCPTCGGTGYSSYAVAIDHGLVDMTFDVLERHKAVKAQCANKGVDYKCADCAGSGQPTIARAN